MRALLSTRLFAATPLDLRTLLFARKGGFPSLELYANPGHLDLLRGGEASSVLQLLDSTETRAPWLRMSHLLIDRLADQRLHGRFVDALAELQIQVVTAALHSLPRDGSSMDLEELMLLVEEAGARLVLDVDRLDPADLRRLPWNVGIGWDLAGPEEEPQVEIAAVDETLGQVGRGRLSAVRAAHRIDHLREPPGEREALLVQEAWHIRGPGVLIYDVDDPTGFGSLADYEAVFAEIHAFHSGGRLPPGHSGGSIFWAALSGG